METTRRVLGRSGIETSPMGLGCWAIGGTWTLNGIPAGFAGIDHAESLHALHAALDLGITLFDTAANYGCGHSERILGRALQGRRDRAILVSKFGYCVDEVTRSVTPFRHGHNLRCPDELGQEVELDGIGDSWLGIEANHWQGRLGVGPVEGAPAASAA